MTPGLAFFYGGMVRSQERPQHAHDELHRARDRRRAVVLLRLQLASATTSVARPDRQLRVRRAWRTRSASSPGSPWRDPHGTPHGLAGPDAIPVLAFAMFQLMFAVITPGADLGRGRRPHEVLELGAVRRRSGRRSSTSRSRTGCSRSTASRGRRSGGWIANDAQARSTSPVGPRSTSTPVPRVSRSRSCSASAAAGRGSRCGRTTCRSCCSAPSLLWFGWFGFNAGSALGANATSPAIAFTNTTVATCRGDARLAARRADPRRQADHPRRRVRRRRRPRRHHPGAGVRQPARRVIAIGVIAGAVCALAVGAQVPVRLRRLARRRRRPPRRWSRRHAAHRLLRHHRASTPPAPTACSTAAASTSSASRRWRRSSVLVYSFVVTSIIALHHQVHDRASASPTRTRPRASTRREHAETAYDFSTLRGVPVGSARPSPGRPRRRESRPRAGKEG